jgi:two-component system phosphate regulon sensor histidine kinase PhoR
MINTIIIKIVLVKFRKKDDLLEFYYVQKNTRTNKTIVYSNSIISEDYKISSAFFDKKLTNEKFKNFNSKRVTEVYNDNTIDKSIYSKVLLRCKIEKSGNLDVLDNAQFEIFFKDIASAMPLQERVSAETLKLIKKELEVSGVKQNLNLFNSGVIQN